MLMLEIMKEYGWTHTEYLDQPLWIIDLARRKMDIQAKLEANRKAQSS
jgi:hypothetical protein